MFHTCKILISEWKSTNHWFFSTFIFLILFCRICPGEAGGKKDGHRYSIDTVNKLLDASYIFQPAWMLPSTMLAVFATLSSWCLSYCASSMANWQSWKTLKEARRTHILSYLHSHQLQICPPGGATCISCKFFHQVAPFALVGNLATRCQIQNISAWVDFLSFFVLFPTLLPAPTDDHLPLLLLPSGAHLHHHHPHRQDCSHGSIHIGLQ